MADLTTVTTEGWFPHTGDHPLVEVGTWGWFDEFDETWTSSSAAPATSALRLMGVFINMILGMEDP